MPSRAPANHIPEHNIGGLIKHLPRFIDQNCFMDNENTDHAWAPSESELETDNLEQALPTLSLFSFTLVLLFTSCWSTSTK